MEKFLFRNCIVRVLFVIFFFLLFYNNCYSQWSHIDLPTTNGGSQICFPDTNFGVIDAGSSYKTFDRGNNWTQFFPTMPVRHLLYLSRDTAVGFSLGNEIVKSVDGGVNWQTVYSLGNIPANSTFSNFYFLPDHHTGYIMFMPFNLGDSVYCVQTTDGGDSWNVINTFYSVDYPSVYNQVKFVNPSTGFFTTSHEIYKTIDGGHNWQLQYTFQNDFVTMAPFSADTVIAITQYYDIWRSIDGGQNWSACTSAVQVPMYAIYYSHNTGYIFGGNGINSGFVLSSIDKGLNWTLAYSDVNTYYFVNSSPCDIVFAAGDNGAVITNNKLFTSVGEIDKNNFSLYPNPVSDQLNLNIIANEFEYKIRDAIGNIVLVGKDSKKIQTGTMHNGYYTIEIESGSARSVKPIVVMHQR
jgi:photosystem II stability/assembly factor-like uncharacterized protein